MENNKKSFFKTLPGILTGIAALIAFLTGLYLALKGPTQPKPHIENKEQISPLEQRQIANNLVTSFIKAYQNNDISKILRISDFPFYFFNEVVVSEEILRSKWKELFSQKGGNFRTEKINYITVAGIKEMMRYDETALIIKSLNLDDQDIVIDIIWSIQNYRGIFTIFTRKIDNYLKISGIFAIET